jgi:hypothetical protein
MTLRRAANTMLLSLAAVLHSAHAQSPVLDTAMRAQLVDALQTQLNAHYVFPAVAHKIGVTLRAKLTRGDYDGITDPETFAYVLTRDLREVGKDRHLRMIARDAPRPNAAAASAEAREEMLKIMAARGYGVANAEILDGNVGYLDLRGFEPIKEAAPTLTAAMTTLADCDALMIDLRNNNGGDPAGVAFLSSYLFEQRTHLNDLYFREGDTTVEFWTDVHVPGKRYGQRKAVYLLIGPSTFSAGEEFSYDLQQLKRATLLGETTGGGANPSRLRALSPFFDAVIPNGRAINPVTRTNWEGSGVTPDISVPVGQVRLTAYKLALQNLVAASSDPQRSAALQSTLAGLTP